MQHCVYTPTRSCDGLISLSIRNTFVGVRALCSHCEQSWVIFYCCHLIIHRVLILTHTQFNSSHSSHFSCSPHTRSLLSWWRAEARGPREHANAEASSWERAVAASRRVSMKQPGNANPSVWVQLGLTSLRKLSLNMFVCICIFMTLRHLFVQTGMKLKTC